MRDARFRTTPRTRALLATLAAISLVAVFTTRVSRKMPDFDVYYTAASRALAGQPLYRADDGHFQFKYLPAFAVIASPVARIPLPAAKGLWFATSALLMLALLWLSLLAVPALHRPAALLLVVTFVAMAKFYAHELVLGQVNLLFAVIALLAIVAMRRGREVAAGLLLALAVVVKPYAVIFVPWLVLRRKPWALAAMAVGLVAALMLPAVRYGWDGNIHLLREWWQTVTATTAPNLTNADNVSVASMFTRYMGPDSSAPLFSLLTTCALISLASVVTLGRGQLQAPDTLEGSLFLLMIPILSPQGWDYVLLIGTPAVMLLINDEQALPRNVRLATLAAMAVIALSLYDVMGREAYSLFMRSSILTVCVLVEIAALVALRFRRAA